MASLCLYPRPSTCQHFIFWDIYLVFRHLISHFSLPLFCQTSYQYLFPRHYYICYITGNNRYFMFLFSIFVITRLLVLAKDTSYITPGAYPTLIARHISFLISILIGELK